SAPYTANTAAPESTGRLTGAASPTAYAAALETKATAQNTAISRNEGPNGPILPLNASLIKRNSTQPAAPAEAVRPAAQKAAGTAKLARNGNTATQPSPAVRATRMVANRSGVLVSPSAHSAETHSRPCVVATRPIAEPARIAQTSSESSCPNRPVWKIMA